MFYVSEVQTTPPAGFKTPLQEMVYATLAQFQVSFERVDNDEAITMEDCILIDERLQVKTVKTLFLCNRQQTDFYLLVTTASKPFQTKAFSSALSIARVSFAPADLLQSMLGTKVGAATLFGVLLDKENQVQVVLDQDIFQETSYGCTDGTTTGYMKLSTAWITGDFLQYAGHTPKLVQL